MSFEIIIPGNVISKKNSQKIIRCGGFPKIMASDAHQVWEKTALQELQFQLKGAKWSGAYPLELHCFFYRKTKQKFDYSNMIESVQDLLVKNGIIEDDSYRHVIPVVDGMAIDKNHPRVVVILKAI